MPPHLLAHILALSKQSSRGGFYTPAAGKFLFIWLALALASQLAPSRCLRRKKGERSLGRESLPGWLTGTEFAAGFIA